MTTTLPLLLLVVTLHGVVGQGSTDLGAARAWLTEYNVQAATLRTAAVNASWISDYSLIDSNVAKALSATERLANFSEEAAKRAESTFDWRNLNDSTVVREFSLLIDKGNSAARDPRRREKTGTLLRRMMEIYKKANVRMKNGRYLSLEPDLIDLMMTSRSYRDLLEAWWKWHDVTGGRMRHVYQQFVTNSNAIIKKTGFSDLGEYWRSRYQVASFQQDVENVWSQLLPLYQQLHAYTRRRLMQIYGENKFPTSGHIPAHLLGSVWAQQWDGLYEDLMPFPDHPQLNVTDNMKAQGYDGRRMLRTAEKFLVSLGLDPMPRRFWDYSVSRIKGTLPKYKVVIPNDLKRSCQSTTWDFYNQRDFRISQCDAISLEGLLTAHRKMGEIEYYMLYKNQPVTFRDGANPAFLDAVSDVIALSAQTPKHLHAIGLLSHVDESLEGQINSLMKMALEKIPSMPFLYVIDQWRWSVFSGETPPEHYNRKWWDLRCRHHGVNHPVGQWLGSAFDPGANHFIPANIPSISHFVSFVYQFQFHKSLCALANHSGPLHTCDIYNSKEAGDALRPMLSLGAKEHWQDAMQTLTGQRQMDAAPLVEYFQPLMAWLQQQNQGHPVGWSDACPTKDQMRGHAPSEHARMTGVTLTLLMVARLLC